nr:hypothetical protein [Pyrinomonadaceae bacterium]
SYHPFGRRKYTGSFVIWLEDSAPELALLRAQTELNLKMSMTGKTIASTSKNLFEIEIFLAFYKTVVLGNKNGFTTLEIKSCRQRCNTQRLHKTGFEQSKQIKRISFSLDFGLSAFHAK